ncbi:hypothetical protein HHI36_018825 [Cryptolaemus montrouzieri]|uniref:Kinesin motor domain-containing protein n=1 Tax=Cryptolaemus montrouzieri TaxID=559131 RepID=A0ABD2P181_9CUCU
MSNIREKVFANEFLDSEADNFLHVYLRVKEGIEDYEDLYEIIDSRTLISKIPESSHSAKNIKEAAVMKRKYDFSKIFGPETKQSSLFNELVKPKLWKFMNGIDCSLMTYGVSGSGKTYTIVGTGQEPGVLPRSLEYIFRTLPNMQKYPEIKPLPNGDVIRLGEKQRLGEFEIKQNILSFNWPSMDRNEQINTYRTMQYHLIDDPIENVEHISDSSIAIWVSFAEIYNEQIFDLLQSEVLPGKSKEKLKLGISNGHTYIKKLTNIYVSSGLEAFQVLQYGLHHLNYAKTKINDHSSRSHSIFTINLVQANASFQEEFYVSRFSFCDLAGVERSKKTMNVGERLKESNNINISLMVLGRCIAGVRNTQKALDYRLLPFRESKLTQIFQNALSGHEDICMIVTVNLCQDFFEETQHVLNFSAIAKEIMVTQQPKDSVKKINCFTETTEDGSPEDNETFREENTRTEVFEDTISEDEINQILNKNITTYSLANYISLSGNQNVQFKNENKMMELALQKEYDKWIKDTKLKYLKENFDECSSSDSSDDENEINNNSIVFKRRSRTDSDIETILYSSDEEDRVSFWKKKMKNQELTINEHHKTISALQEEIMKLKFKNQSRIQELEMKIRAQELQIQELKKKLDGIWNI